MFVVGFPSAFVSQVHLSFQDGGVVQWTIIAMTQCSKVNCSRLGYYSTNAYDKMEIWGSGWPNSVSHKGISGSPARWTIVND
jgi:hypothetical protein